MIQETSIEAFNNSQPSKVTREAILAFVGLGSPTRKEIIANFEGQYQKYNTMDEVYVTMRRMVRDKQLFIVGRSIEQNSQRLSQTPNGYVPKAILKDPITYGEKFFAGHYAARRKKFTGETNQQVFDGASDSALAELKTIIANFEIPFDEEV